MPPPLALAPASGNASQESSILIKPTSTASAAISPIVSSSLTPASLTSKKWVIPPRPKPGRKPATDTPPTKRKAQNRAAQRAFRERRAARVGELEEQIELVEEENERSQSRLRGEIERLEKEVETYRSDLSLWMERCRRLEQDLVQKHEQETNQTAAIPLNIRPNAKAGGSSTPTSLPRPDSQMPVGCGNCTTMTSCQCLEEAFNVLDGAAAQGPHNTDMKRIHPNRHDIVQKRVKKEHHDSLEIDFTGTFTSSHRATPARAETLSPISGVADRCGFCQDGTHCVCEEMAAADDRERQAATTLHHTSLSQTSLMPRISQLSQFTPPPSEGDVSSVQPQTFPNNTFTSEPGSCAQCRADPNRTLFCKSLAASRPPPATSTCCGSSTSGVCCKASTSTDRITGSKTTAATQVTIPSVRLTCADAFTTLSRHPAYERASADIGTWMPKLQAIDSPAQVEGRPALEIDAANVMSVLKDFDRRFGQNL